jgi:hypothetical protein
MVLPCLEKNEGSPENTCQRADSLDQTELHGVPVAGGELLDLLIARAERGQADLLTEVREVWISEHGGMTQELVADVLRCEMSNEGRRREGEGAPGSGV